MKWPLTQPLEEMHMTHLFVPLNDTKIHLPATYATEVTKQITIAGLRGYDSVIDMLLQPQQVTKEMYENQLNIIQKELAPHMRRYAKLVEQDYKLDKIRFCDLKAPLDPNLTQKLHMVKQKK